MSQKMNRYLKKKGSHFWCMKKRTYSSTVGEAVWSPVDKRVVHVNQPSLNDVYRYPKNKTSTTKYTWLSFLPRSLFEQYRRSAYWYFTAMAVLSILPFSPYTPVSVILPLLFVLSLGVLREGWEDLRRSRGDKEINSRPIQVCCDDKMEEKMWRDLTVGDVVLVKDGEYFPADLVLLSSTGPDGICYVETKNLDGETNLKVRQALEATWELSKEGALKTFEADITCEGPNASLYTFTGSLKSPDGSLLPLGPPQLLLRDSNLQNTGEVLGVVVYTGHDTKVMQNGTAPPSKRSRIDRTLDKIIWAMFALLITMSSATGLILGLNTRHEGPDMWYLDPYESNLYFNPNKAVVAGIVSAVNGLVLYGYLIPISLYVSMEFVRVLQALFMMQDLNMYDPTTDKPAKVKSSGLNEELGQVDTILSDKTGTLTCNQMDFFRCSIAGVSYGRGTTEVETAARRLGIGLDNFNSDADGVGEQNANYMADGDSYREKGFNFYDSRLLGGNWMKQQNQETLKLFFQILAVCHTAIPDGKIDSPSTMNYRAESPDEAALVVAAKQFGFYFYKRTPSRVHVRESYGVEGKFVYETYELLSVLEFSSARKRMSVIVRFPDRRLLLLSKGADSVMIGRMNPKNRGYVDATARHLTQFGEVGLRTLLLAYREIEEADYQQWQLKYAEARSVLGRERESLIEEVADEIERDLVIIGGTGVEDKLQEGVPDCIDHLARAGINIWVLTGDKVETAINIGYACSLLRKGMQKIIVSLEHPHARAVEENGEQQGLPREEIVKSLRNIVGQQLTEGYEAVCHSMLQEEQKSTLQAKSQSFHTHALSRNTSSASLSPRFRSSLRHSLRSSSQNYQELQEMQLVDHPHSQEIREDAYMNGQIGFQKDALDRKHDSPSEREIFALVIDGPSLGLILAEDGLQSEFIQLCKHCASVLCCRVSPRQKAQVTTLVQKGMGKNRLCLAIGDGANDVGMIQAANVGVGIAGLEGAQAAMAADYAIGQFRYLERLLLVHGHWCYRRISFMILFFFYKVAIMGWIALYSNIFAYLSGQPLYNDWYASFYNTVFTSLPICVVATIDQDVSAAESSRNPELYRVGHRKEFFNRTLLVSWLANSVYSSAIIFFFPLAVLLWGPSFREGGEVAAIQDFGAVMFSCLILVPNLQLLTATHYFTWIHHLAIWGSITIWYIFLLVYGALPPAYSTVAYKELIEVLAPTPSYWLLQILVIAAALLPDFILRCFLYVFWPSDKQIVAEARLDKKRTGATLEVPHSGVN